MSSAGRVDVSTANSGDEVREIVLAAMKRAGASDAQLDEYAYRSTGDPVTRRTEEEEARARAVATAADWVRITDTRGSGPGAGPTLGVGP